MLSLECTVMEYAWGKKGSDSAVARIQRSAHDDVFQIEEGRPYAELWMGTHPTGPAKIEGTNELLLDYLRSQPSAVGIVPDSYPADDLPFMFKVLSIDTALSVQAHPNRSQAEELHRLKPDIYRDANHKPEMAIALTPFEAMNGFRPMYQILAHLHTFPELRAMVGPSILSRFESVVSNSKDSGSVTDSIAGAEDDKADEDSDEWKLLADLVRAFFECSDEVAAENVRAMVQRLQQEKGEANKGSDEWGEDGVLKALILRLHGDYPGDRGIFFPLLLNYLSLEPGQAFYMGANQPHAYIRGDIIECMALSDNVVRAGLTPKFRDLEVLCSMLNYKSSEPQFLEPLQLNTVSTLYRPPPVCSEFEVEVLALQPHEPHTLAALPCGSILLFLSGEDCSFSVSAVNISPSKKKKTADETSEAVARATAPEEEQRTTFRQGQCFFLPAGLDVHVRPGADGSKLYRARINLGR